MYVLKETVTNYNLYTLVIPGAIYSLKLPRHRLKAIKTDVVKRSNLATR